MILGVHGIIASSISGLDADYQAVLDYATIQGYTLPSASQQTLQNQLVVDLKTAGVWSKLDSFAVFATDGNSDFALIDWINLSQYTAVNSPTFTTNQGFTGNGTSSYIDTNFNPATSGVNYNLDSASFGVYQNSNTTGNYTIIGALTSTSSQRANATWNRGSNLTRINDANSGFPASNLTNTGFNYANRSSSLDVQIYSNGSLFESDTQTSGSIPSLNFYCLAWNFNNVAGFFSPDEISIAFIGGDLSSEVSDFNTVVNTYITSL